MQNRFWTLKRFTLSLLPILLFPVWAHADGPNFSTGLGFEFASGKYGTSTRTQSIYMPFTASVYPTERLGLSLEIPWLYQSSSAVNTTLFGSGGHMMVAQRHAAAITGSGMMGGGSMSSVGMGSSHNSQSGVGDIIAKAGYALIPEGELMPRVTPYVKVKFPTADKDRALGTGAFDEAVGVEFLKRLGNWYSFAEVAYTFQGKSEPLALKDYLSVNAGTGYAFQDKFLPMVIVKTSTAPVAGSSDLLEVRLKLKYVATQHTGIEGYVSKGITTNSPDYGTGVAAYYDF